MTHRRNLRLPRPFQKLIAFAGTASLTCSGCSFVAVAGPPSEPSGETERAAEQCTTSVLYPVLDSLGAVIGAANIGIAASTDYGKVAWYGIEMEPEAGVALGITQLAVFGAGAVYGFVQTSRCKAYRREVQEKPAAPIWSPELAPASPSAREAGTTQASQAPASATTPSAVPPAPPSTAASAPPATTAAPVAPSSSSPPSKPAPGVPTVTFPE